MTKNPLALGIILFIITMIIFFVVYYFFNGINYFTNSLNANAFILPIIYCGVALFSVRTVWKTAQHLSFKEAFSRSFQPMFIGGLLSMLSIFAFLNFGDTGAKDVLNHQFVERNKSELVEVYTKEKSRLKSDKEIQELEKDFKKSMQSFSDEHVKGKDMLTFSHFSAYFAGILIFFTIISLFLGAFFRTKTSLQ